MFRDQSASVSRRLGGSDQSSSAEEPVTRLSPDQERIEQAQAFFHQQFVAPGHFSFLNEVVVDDFLLRPIQACSYMILANRQGRDAGLQALAREHYVAALAATNQTLRDPQQVKEDNTIVAVFLLGIYERMDWERHHSMQSLSSHTHGLAMVLQMRGSRQIRSRTGAKLFRDLRSEVVSLN